MGSVVSEIFRAVLALLGAMAWGAVAILWAWA